MSRSLSKMEFGDFQTPRDLTDAVVELLRDGGLMPRVLIEPTCGLGNFVTSALASFPSLRQVYAFDVNENHLKDLHEALRPEKRILYSIMQQDFFDFNWKKFVANLQGEVLVIGNPPWVTNSALGTLAGGNLPPKANFYGCTGIAAKTGKSNFDISEWMLIRILEALQGKSGCMALLCKTTTARKVLRYGWIHGLEVGRATLHHINARVYFGVSVEACLLKIQTGYRENIQKADVFSDLSFKQQIGKIGIVGKELLADSDEYTRLQDLDGFGYYTWRSGIKHDAAAVMEFSRRGTVLMNGFGEQVDLERDYLYPLLKSSDLAHEISTPRKEVLITQRKPEDDTETISKRAPKTWSYLLRYADLLAKRRSSIYQGRARFSIFGIGEYTFSPWKVTVSGFYKTYKFAVVGKFQDKPICLDDTCYFLPCSTYEEASWLCKLLNSDIAQRFFTCVDLFGCQTSTDCGSAKSS